MTNVDELPQLITDSPGLPRRNSEEKSKISASENEKELPNQDEENRNKDSIKSDIQDQELRHETEHKYRQEKREELLNSEIRDEKKDNNYIEDENMKELHNGNQGEVNYNYSNNQQDQNSYESQQKICFLNEQGQLCNLIYLTDENIKHLYETNQIPQGNIPSGYYYLADFNSQERGNIDFQKMESIQAQVGDDDRKSPSLRNSLTYKHEKLKENEKQTLEATKNETPSLTKPDGPDDKKQAKKRENPNFINLLIASYERLKSQGLLDLNPDQESEDTFEKRSRKGKDKQDKIDKQDKNDKVEKSEKNWNINCSSPNSTLILENLSTSKKRPANSSKKSMAIVPHEFYDYMNVETNTGLNDGLSQSSSGLNHKGKFRGVKKQKKTKISVQSTPVVEPGNKLVIASGNLRKCDNLICNFLAPKQNSPQNKWSKFKIANGNNIWLCSLCSASYVKKQYCYYCFAIYNDLFADGKEWLECDYCKKWHHSSCESKYGKYKDIKKSLEDKNFKYKCPFCSASSNLKNHISKKKSLESAKKLTDTLDKKAKKVVAKEKEATPNNIRRSGRINKEKVNEEELLNNIMLGQKRKAPKSDRKSLKEDGDESISNSRKQSSAESIEILSKVSGESIELSEKALNINIVDDN